MLPKKFRLKHKRCIKKVFLQGKKIYTSLFLCLIKPSNKDHSRMTVIVSKKYDKRAVYRNRLKRKFREAVRENIIDLKENLDIIIVPKKQSDKKHILEIKDMFKSIIN